MILAFELMNKNSKDPNWIKKDLDQMKKKREKLFEIDEEGERVKVKKGGKEVNPVIIMEERHRETKEKRE
jgi:hypothetical protein